MSIGETLTSARENAGISVEQVAEATRLRQTLVRAIEHDDYALCGGDFYARGHIRNIARTVGVDPEPLVAEFDASHGDETAPRSTRSTRMFEPEAVTAERRGPNWSAAMALVLVLVVVYGVVQALTGGNRTDTGGRTAGSDDPTVSSSIRPSPSPTASDPSAVAQAPRDRVTVVVSATARSWLQVTTASGKELFQGLLQAGENRSFTDKQRVKLVVGNAGAVALMVNGTDVGAPGRDGQVARVQFGRDDPAAG